MNKFIGALEYYNIYPRDFLKCVTKMKKKKKNQLVERDRSHSEIERKFANGRRPRVHG
jgi:hypothetical protein